MKVVPIMILPIVIIIVMLVQRGGLVLVLTSVALLVLAVIPSLVIVTFCVKEMKFTFFG